MRNRGIPGRAILAMSALSTLAVLATFGYVCYLLSTGASALKPKFLLSSILEGGILEPIVGTLYLFAGATAIVAPVGTLAAVYAIEYSPRGKLSRLLDGALNNLAGVPSVVFGLFGFTLFCKILGLGVCLLSGWLTLACMMLPFMVRSVEEVLKMVPESVREASLALGATKWQTIRHVVLPAAAPGVMTGIVLSMARVAGETAAILFTACFYTMKGLPTSPLDPVLTLSYYLYVLVMYKPGYLDPSEVFALALVLFALTIALTSAAFAIRAYYRRRWARWT